MPKVPITQFKGLNLKPGDRVQMTVASVGNGEVQFEYVDPKDAPVSKAGDYVEKVDSPEDKKGADMPSPEDNIKYPEKPLTSKDDPSKMDLKELRSRLPVKEEN